MLEVCALGKYFGARKVLDNVTWGVKRGEIMGLIGPNGAGKSTCMRCITGFLLSDEGKIWIDQEEMTPESIHLRQRLGYLPETVPIYPDMTVLSFLEWAGGMRGLSFSQRRKQISWVLELCELSSVQHRLIGTLSKGYRHRVCFAQALVHNPPLLLLDEPTDGLDPLQKEAMRMAIREMGKAHAIVISTHLLEEVRLLCQKVVVLCGGKVQFQGTVGEMELLSPQAQKVRIRLQGKKDKEVIGMFYSLPWIETVDLLEMNEYWTDLLLSFQKIETVDGIYDFCHRYGWNLMEVHREKGDLGSAFRWIVERSKMEYEA